MTAASEDTESGLERFARNIRAGVKFGLVLGVGFSLFVAVLAVLMQSNPFASYGMSFPRGVVMYLATGLAAGAAGGAMAPIARWTTGVMCIGAVCGMLIAIGMGIGTNGVHFWGPQERLPLLGFAVIGAGVAPYTRRRMRRAKERAEEWKRLHTRG
jgi:peptidoglycan/LPS O-acetylase OafA/YrhL